jgi:hypothetical protein
MAAKKRKKSAKKTTKRSSARKSPAKRRAKSNGEVIGHVHFSPGFMHYVKKNGDVMKTKMNRKGRPKGSRTRCRTPK